MAITSITFKGQHRREIWGFNIPGMLKGKNNTGNPAGSRNHGVLQTVLWIDPSRCGFLPTLYQAPGCQHVLCAKNRDVFRCWHNFDMQSVGYAINAQHHVPIVFYHNSLQNPLHPTPILAYTCHRCYHWNTSLNHSWHPSHWILGIWGIWFWASERLQPQPCYFHKSTDFWPLTLSLTTPALEPVQKNMSHRNFARLVQSRRRNTPWEILCFTLMFPVVSSFSFDGKWAVQYFSKHSPYMFHIGGSLLYNNQILHPHNFPLKYPIVDD